MTDSSSRTLPGQCHEQSRFMASGAMTQCGTARWQKFYRELLQEGLQPLVAQLGQLRTSSQETLTVAATPSGGLVEAKRDRSDNRWQRAHFALSVQLLRHLLATENFSRVLQRSGCSATN